MNYNLCLSRALALVEHMMNQPGVLRTKQRSPAFKAKILKAAAFILRRHLRAVREFARLGFRHRIPFARRAVEKLCDVAAYSLEKVIPILERIGLFANRTLLQRWYEAGSARSVTPGAKAYWYRPTLFDIGDEYVAALAGTDLAVSPAAEKCPPDTSCPVLKVDHDVGFSQLIEEVEETRFSTVRRSLSSSSIPTGLDDEDAVVRSPEVSRRLVELMMPTGPKIPLPSIPLPASTRPVVGERPQPEPTPAKPLTDFDLNLLRILREVAETGKAARGG